MSLKSVNCKRCATKHLKGVELGTVGVFDTERLSESSLRINNIKTRTRYKSSLRINNIQTRTQYKRSIAKSISMN